MTLLDEIINNRRKLLDKEKQSEPLREIKQKAEELFKSGYRPADFLIKHNPEKPFLIAEIKKSSPSKGIIRKEFDLDEVINAYKSSNHVNAISVLTEPQYFSGSYDFLKRTSISAERPVLMKDFIFDEYQIFRGFLERASAVLLITAVLTDNEIENLAMLAHKLKMKILLETHTAAEYRRALDFNFNIIGINNRDLKTFITDIYTTIKILESEGKPDGKIIISESGINLKENVSLLWDKGADGFLIGERFMKQNNIEAAIADLFGEIHEKTSG